jgi:GT2 family glycosyltransferase
VHSLLSASDNLSVTICEGGSSDSACLLALQDLNHERVRILNFAMPGFNKAWLLNQGLQTAIADWLLISDADIIWNSDAIQQLLDCVISNPSAICSVARVEESDPSAIALRRNRYTYQSSQNYLEILPVTETTVHRPGCGLVCAAKATFLRLGGYRETFQGWGWEDQDLLIRATLEQIPIYSQAQVTHISHSDVERNQHFNHLSVEESRDRNIMNSVQELAERYSIHVQLPQSLWKSYP